MNLESGQIDRIVREVMRQLLSLGPVSVGSQARSDASMPAAPSALNSPPTLVVADRLVTMASLSGRLVGVARVQVPRDAVVTPLVSDTLREQGIRLERESPAPKVDGTRRESLLLVADSLQTARLTGLLNQRVACWRRCTCPDEALARVASADARDDCRAIVLSPDWARIVCQANRCESLRAAAVNSVQTVRQACQQLDVNVVVIDAASLTDDQLTDVVSQYLSCAVSNLSPSAARSAALLTGGQP